jgi:hypothetical protein
LWNLTLLKDLLGMAADTQNSGRQAYLVEGEGLKVYNREGELELDWPLANCDTDYDTRVEFAPDGRLCLLRNPAQVGSEDYAASVWSLVVFAAENLQPAPAVDLPGYYTMSRHFNCEEDGIALWGQPRPASSDKWGIQKLSYTGAEISFTPTDFTTCGDLQPWLNGSYVFAPIADFDMFTNYPYYLLKPDGSQTAISMLDETLATLDSEAGLIYGAVDGALFVYNADGALQARHMSQRISYFDNTLLLASDGTLLDSSSGGIQARYQDGSPLWTVTVYQAEAPQLAAPAGPLITRETAAGTSSTELTAYNLGGSKLWSTSFHSEGSIQTFLGNEIEAWQTDGQGGVYIAGRLLESWNGVPANSIIISKLEAASGAVLWQQPLPAEQTTCVLAARPEGVVAASSHQLTMLSPSGALVLDAPLDAVFEAAGIDPLGDVRSVMCQPDGGTILVTD